MAHLLRFFDRERKLGKIVGGVSVADINKALVDRFIAFRKGEGVGGHTISRDLAALRGALNFAWREELITSAPFVKDVDPRTKSKPRELTYRMEQVAALLEAAYRTEERRHVFLYTTIRSTERLSTSSIPTATKPASAARSCRSPQPSPPG